MCSNQSLKDTLDVFLNIHSSEDDIAAASGEIFRSLYSRKSAATNAPSLAELRYHLFSIMTAKGVIQLERLPPTINHLLYLHLQF